MKFTQIAVHPESEKGSFSLYALDESGKLWEYAYRDSGRKTTEPTISDYGNEIGPGLPIYEMLWCPVSTNGLPESELAVAPYEAGMAVSK